MTTCSHPSWDHFFLGLTPAFASKSKDRSTQVGAVIVADDNAILSSGWNGFPRGVDDNVEPRHDRPFKYQWTEHAERNAIYNAARRGIPLLGSTLYSSLMPCCDCARAIIQSGIKRVVTPEPDLTDEHRRATLHQDVAVQMLREAKVSLDFLEMAKDSD